MSHHEVLSIEDIEGIVNDPTFMASVGGGDGDMVLLIMMI